MRIPAPLQPAYDAWMAFSKALGRVMSFIILTVLWVVGFGIYGIVKKIMNVVTAKSQTNSYWLPADVNTDMNRQF